MAKRADMLAWAVEELGIGARVSVVHGRAEHVGRDDAPSVSRSAGPLGPSVSRSAGPLGPSGSRSAGPLGPLRAACWLVTARSFAPPERTAEAASPLLAVGGTLIVSEPPDSAGERWPAPGLARLGLVPDAVVRTERAGYMVLNQLTPCPAEYPRPWKRQSRWPLFALPAQDGERQRPPGTSSD